MDWMCAKTASPLFYASPQPRHPASHLWPWATLSINPNVPCQADPFLCAWWSGNTSGSPTLWHWRTAQREGALCSAGTESSKLAWKENRGTSLGDPDKLQDPFCLSNSSKGNIIGKWKFSSQNDTCLGLPGQHRVWNWAKFYPALLRNEEGSGFLRALRMWPLWPFFPTGKSL